MGSQWPQAVELLSRLPEGVNWIDFVMHFRRDIGDPARVGKLYRGVLGSRACAAGCDFIGG